MMFLSRYFRFRLRTLLVLVFVASVPLGWVAYQLKWIRERHALLRSDIIVEIRGEGSSIPARKSPLPIGLRVFGETPLDVLVVSGVPDIAEAQRLFPEARVFNGIQP